jgi:hypothetical protein
MEERDFKSEGGIFTFPQLQAIRFTLNYDPPQIGMFYKRSPRETKTHLFLVQLNNLLLLGDPDKITEVLFQKYPAFLNEAVVSVEQVYRLVAKLVDFLHSMVSQLTEEGAKEEVF